MKVLHVIPAVAPRYGGPSQAIFEMCRALAERGLDVSLATTDADGPSRLPVRIGAAFEYQGVRTRFFSARWGERFNYSPVMARWLGRNADRFDVVHIHAVFSHPCLAAAKACRKHGVPYVVRPLGSLDPWSMRQKPLRKLLMWKLAAGRMLRGAAAIHYTTSEEKKRAESSLALDCGVVIPLGIDLPAFEDTATDIFRENHPALGDRPYVLVLSRIHPKKNVELLLEAFLSLAKQPKLEHWRLVIAGDGETDYVSSLQAAIARFGGSDKVIFTGWLEGAEKVSAFQDASLFALPSHQENFGIAAAEALACGVPVLVSEHVNLAAEIERAKAGWVTSLKASAFSHALAEAMNDSEERQRRGCAGEALVNNSFSWGRISAELVKLYSSIEIEGASSRRSSAAS